MTYNMTPERRTAQIACEAIINHEDEGYTLRDMAEVVEVASRTGVAPFYVDEVVLIIERNVRAAREGLGL